MNKSFFYVIFNSKQSLFQLSENGAMVFLKLLLNILSIGLLGLLPLFVVSCSSPEDKTNDTAISFPSSVTALADLDVSVLDVAITGTAALPIHVSASIRNKGALDSTSFVAFIYFSTDTVLDDTDLYLGSCSFMSLMAGSTSDSCDKDVTIPPGTNGTRYIILKADAGSEVKESNETNNVLASTAITVTDMGLTLDLTATSISGVPSSAIGGDSLSLSAVITNSGTVDVDSQVTKFYLSIDNVITSSDTQLGDSCSFGLVAGADDTCAQTVGIPNVTPGTYYVGVLADAYEAIYESDETNNTISSQISILASYVIETDPTATLSNVGDTEMYFYDTDGATELYYNDDRDSDDYSKITVLKTALNSGSTYYVKVIGYYYFTYYYTGDYAISLRDDSVETNACGASAINTFTDSTDPADDVSTGASTLSVGCTYQLERTLLDGDEDWFKIVIP